MDDPGFQEKVDIVCGLPDYGSVKPSM